MSSSILFHLNFLKRAPLTLDVRGQRLFWLVKLRLFAIAFQLPLTLLGRYYGYLNESTHLIFVGILIFLLLNSAYIFQKLVRDHSFIVSELYLSLQVTSDLVAFTVLLSISGSANNPFYAFFYVMAVLGGIFSSGRGSLIFGITLMLSVFLIQIQPAFFHAESLGIILHPQTFPYLLSQLAIPFLIYLIARSFGSLLDKSQERLLALAVKNERLDRLRALGSLSAGFSHEFASPLQNAKLRLKRIAQSSTAHDDVNECMESIQDCELVLRKMNLSQLTFSQQDFDTVELDLLTQEAIETWKESHPDSIIHQELENGIVRLNRINYVQVLFNLLDNAQEASERNERISIKMRKENAFLVLSIEDSGKGFPVEILERLGEPFNTNKEKGTGLGLYSTFLFMSSIGGHIEIKNLPLKGAKVELYIPSEVSK